MSKHQLGGYFPQYPHHDSLPDPEIRTFITNFYRASDRQDANELWVSYFTKDAQVTMGRDGGAGQQEIREMRNRMWTAVRDRQHTVTKVFPGRFQDPGAAEEPVECELMLFGEVKLTLKGDGGGVEEGAIKVVPWAGHAVVRKEKEGEREEWKFTRYRVWLQT